MKRTTITLTDDLAELVEHEAGRLHISVSELVRRIIHQAFAGSADKPREIPWAGIFDDPEMVSGENIDDELREKWADDIDSHR
jgi:hypothetical protein